MKIGLNMFLIPINIGYFSFGPSKILALILVPHFSLLGFWSISFRSSIKW